MFPQPRNGQRRRTWAAGSCSATKRGDVTVTSCVRRPPHLRNGLPLAGDECWRPHHPRREETAHERRSRPVSAPAPEPATRHRDRRGHRTDHRLGTEGKMPKSKGAAHSRAGQPASIARDRKRSCGRRPIAATCCRAQGLQADPSRLGGRTVVAASDALSRSTSCSAAGVPRHARC